MSLILDALNKADRERQKPTEAPKLQSVHQPYTPVDTSSQWKHYIPHVLGSVSVLLLMFVIYILIDSKKPDLPQIAQSKPAQSVSAKRTLPQRNVSQPTSPREVKQISPVVPSQPSNARSLKTSSEIKDRQANAQAELKVAQAAEPSADNTQKGTLKQVKSSPLSAKPNYETAVNSLYDRPAPQVTAPSSPKPKPVPKVRSKPVITEKQIDTIMYDGATPVRKLPWSVQENIPTLMYSEHNFQPDGTDQSSTVTLNKGVWSVGDKVAPGITIEEIRENSLILKYDEHRFGLEAMSSWVNM